MNERSFSQPKYLSVIWLILALIICIGNISTTYILWLSKITREKSELGRVKIHALWNLMCINLAFSLVGLSLFVNMAMLLARNGELSDGLPDVFGFLHTFGFNIAAVGILVNLMDKIYILLRPFEYQTYVKYKSKIPMIIFVCCTLYGLFLAVLPLTRLGNYYQSKYATCLVSWDEEVATRVTVVFNIALFFITVAFIFLNLWLTWRLYTRRRKMGVSVYRHKETLVFVLVVSSLFLICWFPYMVRIGSNLYISGFQ